jgi:dolichol kinase
MFNREVFSNVILMLLCYAYVLLVILVSSRMDRLLHLSAKTSRKFLHAMIGNLPFVIPFFTSSVYPVLVAAPFVLVTFFVSPYSPFPNVRKKLPGLAGITEEGHKLGLVFYAISYTVLASVLPSKPYVIAAGILPMAYGDAAASIIGERYGRRRYRIFADKSLEGSAAMFLASFLSLSIGLVFFSALYSFSVLDKLFAVLAAVIAATLVECVSPLGFDNLTVPVSSALTFLALSGGI